MKQDDGIKLKHKNCPRYCHRCPDMQGGVMPFCYGTIMRGDGWKDLSACTCERPARKQVVTVASLQESVDRLQAEVDELKKALSEGIKS